MDDAPIPSDIVEARSEIDALIPILEELPLRTRRAFKAALFDLMPYRDIAEELGVSLRTIEVDVQRAIEHCARRLGRDVIRRPSGPRRHI